MSAELGRCEKNKQLVNEGKEKRMLVNFKQLIISKNRLANSVWGGVSQFFWCVCVGICGWCGE